MRPGVKGAFTSTPASLAAFSIAAPPARTIDTFLPPVAEALNSFWIASSFCGTFAN
jgi:hypothetical protein